MLLVTAAVFLLDCQNVWLDKGLYRFCWYYGYKVDKWLKLKIVIFFHMVWVHFYADHIRSSCAPSVWEHDRGGCNKLQRGNCGWPGCLPQWTRDWGSKLKDRIIEKIRIEIEGSTSKRAWSTNPAPFLLSVKLHPFSCLLSCSCFSISTVHGRIQYAASVSQHLTRLNQIQHPPSQELDFHLLNLLQGLFRNVSLTLRWKWLPDYAAVLILALD